MTQLLVSVRTVDEALAALAGGADLIDVKEPSRGPLGAADPLTWAQVRDAVGGNVPVSAALGELVDLADSSDVQGVTLVKAGLAQCADWPDWRTRLVRLKDALPATTGLVAVAYADAELANAPSPRVVLDTAIELSLSTLLIDTFAKSGGNLWHALSDDEIGTLLELAHQHGVRVALAGSLDTITLSRALALGPDWIAVRGAACVGGRTGRVTSERVATLKAAIFRHESKRSDFP